MLVQVACSNRQRFHRYELVNAVMSDSAERGIELLESSVYLEKVNLFYEPRAVGV